MTTDTRSTELTKTCVFLKITLSRLGDKKGVSSDEIEVDADKKFVKVRKVIFKTPSFDKIKSLDAEIRRWVRVTCLPFDPGIHLLPLKLVETVNTQLTAYEIRRNEYVGDLAQIMPSIIDEMPKTLRVLFKREDYERFQNIETEFFMNWQYLMFTSPMELENFNSQIFKEEQLKLRHRLEEAYEGARLILRETCLELVQHLRDRLEPEAYGAPKRLATSTLTNLLQFVNDYHLRDITDDRELQQYTTQIKQLLNGVDIESLRNTDGIRARVRSELQHIEESIDSGLIRSPQRRIKRVHAA